MEARRVILNMYFERYKGLVDKRGYIVVGKRFGLQPNTASSAGRSAKINKEWQGNFFCLRKGTLYIFSPLNSHILIFLLGQHRFPSIVPRDPYSRNCPDFRQVVRKPVSSQSLELSRSLRCESSGRSAADARHTKAFRSREARKVHSTYRSRYNTHS